MTPESFALQVAAIGGQQVWHAAWLTLMWAVLLAALVTVLWGIVHPGRWIRPRPAKQDIGDDVIAMHAEWKRQQEGKR